MSEIADFLRTMLEQDKARQRDIWEQWHHKDCEAVPQVLYPDRETGSCDCGIPARVIADCDAKLALIDHHEEIQAYAEVEQRHEYVLAAGACAVALKILAQPFAGHPDHKGGEWAP